MIDPILANWIIVAWLAALGAIIGSFLNVVVYRLPLGLSLSKPPSHCPQCKHPIRWYDNVPVFGWIFLRGRCRDCGNPIPIRYPLVEAVNGLMFGLVAYFEYVGEGHNLPTRLPDVVGHMTSSELTAACSMHMVLLCTLLCAALIEFDGQRPPFRLFLPTLLVAFICGGMWPMARPMASTSGLPEAAAGWIDGLIGFAVGAAIGGAFAGLSHFGKPQIGMFWSLAGVGVCLGWQATIALALVTLGPFALNGLLRYLLPKLRQLPATMWLLALTLLWILFWTQLVSPLLTN